MKKTTINIVEKSILTVFELYNGMYKKWVNEKNVTGVKRQDILINIMKSVSLVYTYGTFLILEHI